MTFWRLLGITTLVLLFSSSGCAKRPIASQGCGLGEVQWLYTDECTTGFALKVGKCYNTQVQQELSTGLKQNLASIKFSYRKSFGTVKLFEEIWARKDCQGKPASSSTVTSECGACKTYGEYTNLKFYLKGHRIRHHELAPSPPHVDTSSLKLSDRYESDL